MEGQEKKEQVVPLDHFVESSKDILRLLQQKGKRREYVGQLLSSYREDMSEDELAELENKLQLTHIALLKDHADSLSEITANLQAISTVMQTVGSVLMHIGSMVLNGSITVVRDAPELEKQREAEKAA